MAEPPDAAAGEYVTVAEAARRLGVAGQSVRNWLRRGKLAGEKRGDTWYVFFPSATNTTGVTMAPPDEPPADITAAAPNDLAERVSALEAVIDRQQVDLERLRDELAQDRSAIALIHEQLRNLEGRASRSTDGSEAELSEVAWLREQQRALMLALIERHGQ